MPRPGPAHGPIRAPARAPVRYRVKPADLHAHLYQVQIEIEAPAAAQTVSLPVWIPGSYLVRDYSRSLQKLSAHQGRTALPIVQLDKASWRIDCTQGRRLSLRYEVVAIDQSVRGAFLDAARGFFNGTSLCLRVHGQEELPHELTLLRHPARRQWQAATALRASQTGRDGFGTYLANGYDELVDSPFEIGEFWQGAFQAHGTAHRVVVSGAAPSFDAARLLADVQAICETAIRFWHGTGKPPFADYLFMLHACDDDFGGLEHRHSTALLCARRDLPRLAQDEAPGGASQAGSRPAAPAQHDGYRNLLSLVSHEYFHAWNIKRMRPREFERPRYQVENYTALLWFFEGFTNYYDELLLRRAGLCDDASYLRQLGRTINQLLQTPGRLVQSAAQASFDAWVKFYRPDDNQANATVNYYTKGALVALCLDLTLRQESSGKASLDQVMRLLWRRSRGALLSEPDILDALASVGARRYEREIAAWVHGTGELPLPALLEAQGIQVLPDEAPMAQRLGLRVDAAHGIKIKTVLRAGAAEKAGFAAGDEWLAVDEWRLHKLEDLPHLLGRKKKTSALVSRDQRLLRLELTLPPNTHTWRLQTLDAAKVREWLAPERSG